MTEVTTIAEMSTQSTWEDGGVGGGGLVRGEGGGRQSKEVQVPSYCYCTIILVVTVQGKKLPISWDFGSRHYPFNDNSLLWKPQLVNGF